MTYNRKNFDLSNYLVIGPENTHGRNTIEVIRQAIEGGMTFVQIRAKTLEAREIIQLTLATANLIKEMDKQEAVTLVVNDRLDVVLACREAGAKVDGIHVGQKDIPVSLCRKYLGEESVVGLSATTKHLVEYVKTADTSEIDYFGAGPLHPTDTKPEAGYYDEVLVTKTFDELHEFAGISPVPVVIGGGVKTVDLPKLAQTGVDGYFVVSAIAGAENPREAAHEMVTTWKTSTKKGE